ncbi:MAG: carboxypeptidase-like regulatory domain-containing protein [Prevotellaceae bacterium]|jgi:hypothetical protein|nr:carboxypeptidase-like regulatory domain-containing protein [Prevotellaceae bacterium]
MKKIFYLMAAAALACGCAENAPNEGGESSSGSIYDVITDNATGEPVRSAGVTLSPTGATAATGSEGQYELTGMKAGEPAICAATTGYADPVCYKITVAAERTEVNISLTRSN